MKLSPASAAFLAPPALRALAATWRYVEHAEDGTPGPTRSELGRTVLALWHAELLALMMRYGPLGAASMASRHGDGEVAAAVLRSIGAVAVRGSSSRGGGDAQRELIELGRRTDLALALTTDGPRGPAHRSKPGIVRIAAATGRPIVPIAGWPESAWRMRSWDRFLVPKPFTRVHTAFGTPMFIPTDAAEADLEGWLRRVDAALEALSARCATYAGVEEG